MVPMIVVCVYVFTLMNGVVLIGGNLNLSSLTVRFLIVVKMVTKHVLATQKEKFI